LATSAQVARCTSSRGSTLRRKRAAGGAKANGAVAQRDHEEAGGTLTMLTNSSAAATHDALLLRNILRWARAIDNERGRVDGGGPDACAV